MPERGSEVGKSSSSKVDKPPKMIRKGTIGPEFDIGSLSGSKRFKESDKLRSGNTSPEVFQLGSYLEQQQKIQSTFPIED